MGELPAGPGGPGGCEHQLLLACARTSLDAGARARLRAVLARPVDWERVLGLARLHRVIPLVHRSLGAAGNAGVPEAARAALHAETLAIVQRNLVLARELAALLDDLAAAGVVAVPFKGPELALNYYGALGLRQFGDLDIVVTRGQFAQARRALEGRGYAPPGGRGAASEVARVRERHDYMFVREDGVMVDLQWGVLQRPFAFPLDPARAGASVELCGRAYPAFAAEELLVALCVHGSKHLWERLGWVCDIAELLRARPDLGWVTVLERARALRVERMLRLGLLLGAGMGVAAPPEIGRWAAADPVAGALAAKVLRAYGRDPDAPSTAEEDAPLFYLRMHEAWRDRLGLGLRLAPALRHPRRLWARYGKGLARPLLGGEVA